MWLWERCFTILEVAKDISQRKGNPQWDGCNVCVIWWLPGKSEILTLELKDSLIKDLLVHSHTTLLDEIYKKIPSLKKILNFRKLESLFMLLSTLLKIFLMHLSWEILMNFRFRCWVTPPLYYMSGDSLSQKCQEAANIIQNIASNPK